MKLKSARQAWHDCYYNTSKCQMDVVIEQLEVGAQVQHSSKLNTCNAAAHQVQAGLIQSAISSLAPPLQRLGHWLYQNDRRDLAYFIQMRTSEMFGVDIHPAATIGQGIMIDHAHSIVVGETAVVGDNVSMLHSVTLGGTGKDDDDRHPKIGDGVLIGAGAKVLGNIKVGHCSRIAAGSVVLEEVPPMKTVAGVPAKIVGEAGCSQPSLTMDQILNTVK